MGASADDIALFSGGGSASADDVAMFAAPAAHPIFGRPKMPEPKSDEELGLDEGPKFFRGTPALLFADTKSPSGRIVANARDAPGTEAYASRHAGDEMNDTGAQLITGGALAAPGAALVGAAAPAALAPLASGAAAGGQQAAFQGQNPLVGAALGALPGVPAAAGAIDRAIGEAALRNVRPVGSPPGPIAKLLGKGVDLAAGGPAGLIIGHGKAAPFFSKAGDAATTALADRFLRQELASPAASARVANLVQLPSSVETIAPPAPSMLSPLVHEPLPPPTEVPPGTFEASPPAGDFDALPTGARGHATVGGETAAGPKLRRLQIQDEHGNDLVGPGAKPSLRDDVIRDAGRFRGQGPDVDEPPAVPLESQLERSVRMLSELKTAKAAGKVSPTMIQDAVKAGMSPQAIAKVVGRDAFDGAMGGK
jgi:hypothetical protein